MSPSITQAVAASGRSVYRTLGNGVHHCCLPIIASAMLSWLIETERTSIFASFCRTSSSSFLSTLFSK